MKDNSIILINYEISILYKGKKIKFVRKINSKKGNPRTRVIPVDKDRQKIILNQGLGIGSSMSL